MAHHDGWNLAPPELILGCVFWRVQASASALFVNCMSIVLPFDVHLSYICTKGSLPKMGRKGSPKLFPVWTPEDSLNFCASLLQKSGRFRRWPARGAEIFRSQGLSSTGSCNKSEIRRWMGQRYILYKLMLYHPVVNKKLPKNEANDKTWHHDIMCKADPVTCSKKDTQLLLNSCTKVSGSCTLCLQLSRFGCLGTFPGLAATQCCGRQGGWGDEGQGFGGQKSPPQKRVDESFEMIKLNGWHLDHCSTCAKWMMKETMWRSNG